MLVSILFTA